jgi:hypothetical protein
MCASLMVAILRLPKITKISNRYGITFYLN